MSSLEDLIGTRDDGALTPVFHNRDLDRMDPENRTAVSKFLSFVLRHQPEAVGLTLDASGWVAVDLLLEACTQHDHPLTRAQLDEVVSTNPKQRFAFSPDGQQIRANQGHSTPVDLDYRLVEPPKVLFHGTVARLLPLIRDKGLLQMDRHHVHLSVDQTTARTVGLRRGKPVILQIDAQAMHRAGHAFFETPNGVWLTEAVPKAFITRWGEE